MKIFLVWKERLQAYFVVCLEGGEQGHSQIEFVKKIEMSTFPKVFLLSGVSRRAGARF